MIPEELRQESLFERALQARPAPPCLRAVPEPEERGWRVIALVVNRRGRQEVIPCLRNDWREHDQELRDEIARLRREGASSVEVVT